MAGLLFFRRLPVCWQRSVSVVVVVVVVTVSVLLTGCASSTGKNARSASEKTILPPGPYMRLVQPDEHTVSLQIALRRFEPARDEGPSIWLAAASHIAESNYFAVLQQRLDRVSLVLFEGVNASSELPPFNEDEQPSMQQSLADSLGLVFQLSAMDYDRSHFRNSDLTVEQLQQLLGGGEPNADPGTAPSASEEFDELLQVMDGSSVLGTLLQAGLKLIGSSGKLQAMTKVMLIEMLGQLKGDLAQMEGVPPEIQQLLIVIIHERDKIVIADLRKALNQKQPPTSIGVLYGAGHMADLESRLRTELDYLPTAEEWLTAITVDTQRAGLSKVELDALRGLVRWQMQALQP